MNPASISNFVIKKNFTDEKTKKKNCKNSKKCEKKSIKDEKSLIKRQNSENSCVKMENQGEDSSRVTLGKRGKQRKTKEKIEKNEENTILLTKFSDLGIESPTVKKQVKIEEKKEEISDFFHKKNEVFPIFQQKTEISPNFPQKNEIFSIFPHKENFANSGIFPNFFPGFPFFYYQAPLLETINEEFLKNPQNDDLKNISQLVSSLSLSDQYLLEGQNILSELTFKSGSMSSIKDRLSFLIPSQNSYNSSKILSPMSNFSKKYQKEAISAKIPKKKQQKTSNFVEIAKNSNTHQNLGNFENMKKSENCENCRNSENFKNCENPKNCENLKNSENCENLKNSENAKNCENWDNFKNFEKSENSRNLLDMSSQTFLNNLIHPSPDSIYKDFSEIIQGFGTFQSLNHIE